MYTILNPHISDFLAEPVFYKLAKRRPLKKYGYLISEAVKKDGFINILVDSGTSGFMPMGIYQKLPYYLRLKLSKIEIRWWKRINNFGDEVSVFFLPEKIPNKENLIFFNYKHYKNSAILAKTCSVFKNCIVHLSHYHNDTRLQSSTLKAIPNIYLAADVDISQNLYFKKYFNWYTKNLFILPFAVESRFIQKQPWELRKNKILSMGTFHFFEESYLSGNAPELKDFYETSHAKALHPLRREIFERKDELREHIDCNNSPYIEPNAGKSIWKIISPAKLFASQQNYFSFDMVDRLNEYKFVIVGEELITGFPGIGTYEALACGCVVIGDKSVYGKAPVINLITEYALTPEKAIEIMKDFNTPATHISKMRAEDNFLLVKDQLAQIN